MFRKIATIYKVIHNVIKENENEITTILSKFHTEYKKFGNINLIPKMYVLLHYSEKEFNKNGELSLFFE